MEDTSATHSVSIFVACESTPAFLDRLQSMTLTDLAGESGVQEISVIPGRVGEEETSGVLMARLEAQGIAPSQVLIEPGRPETFFFFDPHILHHGAEALQWIVAHGKDAAETVVIRQTTRTFEEELRQIRSAEQKQKSGIVVSRHQEATTAAAECLRRLLGEAKVQGLRRIRLMPIADGVLVVFVNDAADRISVTVTLGRGNQLTAQFADLDEAP